MIEKYVKRPKIDNWKLEEGHNFRAEQEQFDYDISGLSCDEHIDQANFAS